MKNIAVFASGSGTNFQSLIDHMAGIDGEIKLLVASNSGAYAIERAKLANIPVEIVGSRDENATDKLIDLMRKNNVDLIVLAGYMSILDARFIAAYEGRIINIHPSLIPAFCGKGFYGIRVAAAMIERGVKLAGATVHFVDEGADTGPIILQRAIDVEDDDTPESLQKRVLEHVEHELLPEAVRLFCADRLEIVNGRVRVHESAKR